MDTPVASLQLPSWARRHLIVAATTGAGLIWSCGGEQPSAPGEAQVAAVTLDPSFARLIAAGDTARLVAVAKDQQGSTLPGKTFTWASSASAVATVDGGLVTAVGDGMATITATTAGVQGSGTVTVGRHYALVWPIDCVPGQTCLEHIGYPDIDEDGQAFDCGAPGYTGHQGTDINLTWERMDAGVAVLAAAAGDVLWVFDGKYDRCPSSTEPDCQPPSFDLAPGLSSGHTVCTQSGNYCGTGSCCCFWCFAGGNVVVIRHTGVPGVFATRYDHLKKNSILVQPGQHVEQGQQIAEAASAGNSSGPHLHFEVWGSGYYELADPWAGPCGPNRNNPLWAFDPPWESS